jgi:hypothetical protein
LALLSGSNSLIKEMLAKVNFAEAFEYVEPMSWSEQMQTRVNRMMYMRKLERVPNASILTIPLQPKQWRLVAYISKDVIVMDENGTRSLREIYASSPAMIQGWVVEGSGYDFWLIRTVDLLYDEHDELNHVPKQDRTIYAGHDAQVFSTVDAAMMAARLSHT